MIDQAEENDQVAVEMEINETLTKLHSLLQEWDGYGYEELSETMTKNVEKWKKTLFEDKGAVGEEAMKVICECGEKMELSSIDDTPGLEGVFYYFDCPKCEASFNGEYRKEDE